MAARPLWSQAYGAGSSEKCETLFDAKAGGPEEAEAADFVPRSPSNNQHCTENDGRELNAREMSLQWKLERQLRGARAVEGPVATITIVRVRLRRANIDGLSNA